jgi:RNA polymerase sigma factor (sigma-70 family)
MNGEQQHIYYWEQIRKGDQQALFELYNDLYFHLVRFGLKQVGDDELVKDCITQLFLKIWDGRQKLSAVTQVKSYLFSSLRNLLLDHYQQQNRLSDALHQMAQVDGSRELSYEEIIIQTQQDDELKQRIKRAFAQLSPKQLELVRLKFFEGLSYEQLALRSAQSVKTAYNTIYEAVKILRKELK